jgi:hypothetical protein
MTPAGGNEVFCDGSAESIKIDQMRDLTSWNVASNQCYFCQDRQDFASNLPGRVDASYMKPQ